MSLIKWTLAMAGTAMGLRYMSDRHRRRIAGQGEDTRFGEPSAGTQRAGQLDRDSERSPTAWSAPQGGGSGSLAGPAAAGGLGAGSAGSSTGLGGAASVTQDDLLAPDSDAAPGSSSNRF